MFTTSHGLDIALDIESIGTILHRYDTGKAQQKLFAEMRSSHISFVLSRCGQDVVLLKGLFLHVKLNSLIDGWRKKRDTMKQALYHYARDL